MAFRKDLQIKNPVKLSLSGFESVYMSLIIIPHQSHTPLDYQHFEPKLRHT
jgi:hypothetical protein